MTPRAFVVLTPLCALLAGYVAGAAPVHPLAPSHHPGAMMATITAGPKRGELTLELPPVDLAPGAAIDEPASVAEFPVTGAIYAFRAVVIDERGQELPMDLLHHVNVMNPAERELFLPISRRILAAGRETGAVHFPWILFGAPVRAGERILANAMVHNPTATTYRGVRVRMVLSYVPEGRPWPLFPVLPWQLDVAFPVGDKSFDLPPGRSERSYEASPAVEGKLLVIGGHMHEYGRTIELWDATTGQLLWHGEPGPAPRGEPSAVPLSKLYSLNGIGLGITPAHRYRVRVIYENPTGRTISAGGMGVVGGLFMPQRDAVWPKTDPGDSLYQQDLRHFMGAAGSMAPMH